MTRVLLTAFEPFDDWKSNSSWLTLVELTRDLPAAPEVTTRLYPVDFAAVRSKLAEDLTANYDFAIHLGQSAAACSVELELFSQNVRQDFSGDDSWEPLEKGGPAGYRSGLPLQQWAAAIREQGVPARVSRDAGAYLCNAIYFWSHFLTAAQGLKTRPLFVHVPLATRQVLEQPERTGPSLPTPLAAAGVRFVLAELGHGGA